VVTFVSTTLTIDPIGYEAGGPQNQSRFLFLPVIKHWSFIALPVTLMTKISVLIYEGVSKSFRTG
jgi:hypothetical protein